MKSNWLLVISLTLVVAIVGLCSCTSPGVSLEESLSELKVSLIPEQQEMISVTGEGKVTVVPDIVTLSLGVVAQQASIAEAQTQTAEAMDKVITALTDNGLNERDIQTQYFNVRQVTRWDPETEQELVVGYEVTNMVIAKVRVLDYESYTLDYKVGTVINAVVEAGRDLTRIKSISFSVDDPSDYYKEAIGEAMADAETKAQQLAELAGVTLGKPIYISEWTSYPIYPVEVYMEAAAVTAAPTPISPGEIEIILTVQVSYAILE